MYIFLIFPGHLEFWSPLQIPSWGPPLGCTLFQYCIHIIFYICYKLYYNISLTKMAAVIIIIIVVVDTVNKRRQEIRKLITI